MVLMMHIYMARSVRNVLIADMSQRISRIPPMAAPTAIPATCADCKCFTGDCDFVWVVPVGAVVGDGVMDVGPKIMASCPCQTRYSIGGTLHERNTE